MTNKKHIGLFAKLSSMLHENCVKKTRCCRFVVQSVLFDNHSEIDARKIETGQEEAKIRINNTFL